MHRPTQESNLISCYRRVSDV